MPVAWTRIQSDLTSGRCVMARRAKVPSPTRMKAGSWPQVLAMLLFAMRASAHVFTPRSARPSMSSDSPAPSGPASRRICNRTK